MSYVIVGAVVVILACAFLAPQIVRGLRSEDPFRPLTHVPDAGRPAHTHMITTQFVVPYGQGPRTSKVACFDPTCTRDGDAYTIRRAREGRR